jgi:hypothetical protein
MQTRRVPCQVNPRLGSERKLLTYPMGDLLVSTSNSVFLCSDSGNCNCRCCDEMSRWSLRKLVLLARVELILMAEPKNRKAAMNGSGWHW